MFNRVLTFAMYFVVSNACLANDVRLVSRTEMVNESDIVALVTVRKGAVVGDSFELVAKVRHTLKGDSIKEIKFTHYKNNWSESPSKIGGEYLVFLVKNRSQLETADFAFSVIELEKFYSSRPDRNLILAQLGLKNENLQLYQEFYWYAAACLEKNNENCNRFSKIIRGQLGEDRM